MKTLVVVHVYYSQLWPELAACGGRGGRAWYRLCKLVGK